MNRGVKTRHIVVLAAAVLMLLPASCSKEKILGRNRVANIMYEMFVADQYAKKYEHINQGADSILLYQHIFEKYKCTLEDYQRSIKHYLQDEKDYVHILKTATELAKNKAEEAEKESRQTIHTLYYPIPYAAPPMVVKDWWNKDLYGNTIVQDYFYQELKRIAGGEGKNDETDGGEAKMSLIFGE